MAIFSRAAKPVTPLHGIDTILADLDGVVYAGPGALPHAVESLNRARETVRIGYITNNASRTDATVANHLSSLGLATDRSDVVTSPQAAVRMLRTLVPDGSTILIVGGEGLVFELEKGGYVVTRSSADNPAAVVQGFAPDVDWSQLAEAAYALAVPETEGGIPWISTNIDWTIPQERGIAPGNGTLVSAVHTATGRLSTVAGKPEKAIFEVAVERFACDNALFIGDRLDTDIAGAQRAGISALLVLTGIDRPKHVLAAPAGSQPEFIVGDLRSLFEPYPPTIIKGDVVRVGDAAVRVEGQNIRILSEGKQIDLLRAGANAIWRTGRQIFGFNVPEILYADPFLVRR